MGIGKSGTIWEFRGLWAVFLDVTSLKRRLSRRKCLRMGRVFEDVVIYFDVVPQAFRNSSRNGLGVYNYMCLEHGRTFVRNPD